ncbi:hypothetical protein KY285_036239 [Solanum tuberosum]|nr:hypothetical protein KY285_036239 [Solanum tuberosum]
MDSLSRIGSGLSVPLYADNCTTIVERILFARILVEMNVTRHSLNQYMLWILMGGVHKKYTMIGFQNIVGMVVKKNWHKKSPNDAHKKAISMLADTLVTTQEKQWQNVKGKSKTIPHPAQNTVDTRNGFNPLVIGTIPTKPLKSMGKDTSQDIGGGGGLLSINMIQNESL